MAGSNRKRPCSTGIAAKSSKSQRGDEPSCKAAESHDVNNASSSTAPRKLVATGASNPRRNRRRSSGEPRASGETGDTTGVIASRKRNRSASPTSPATNRRTRGSADSTSNYDDYRREILSFLDSFRPAEDGKEKHSGIVLMGFLRALLCSTKGWGELHNLDAWAELMNRAHFRGSDVVTEPVLRKALFGSGLEGALSQQMSIEIDDMVPNAYGINVKRKRSSAGRTYLIRYGDESSGGTRGKTHAFDDGGFEERLRFSLLAIADILKDTADKKNERRNDEAKTQAEIRTGTRTCSGLFCGESELHNRLCTKAMRISGKDVLTLVKIQEELREISSDAITITNSHGRRRHLNPVWPAEYDAFDPGRRRKVRRC